jgi:hypothetical protein
MKRNTNINGNPYKGSKNTLTYQEGTKLYWQGWTMETSRSKKTKMTQWSDFINQDLGTSKIQSH